MERLYLDHWDRSRFDVEILTTFHDGSFLGKLWHLAKAIPRFVGLLILRSPNLVHIHFADRASFYRKAIFLLISRLFKKATIMHCHAGGFESDFANKGDFGRYLILKVLEHSTALIAVSNRWRTYFEGLGLSVPIFTVYNPVEVDRNPERTPSERQIVLTLGKLTEAKGIYDTLDAIPLVLDVCPKAEFWFGGDGDLAEIDQWVKAHWWTSRVRLLGWITGQQKKAVLGQASVFVLPSYKEGLPLAVLEAMAHKLPVVATSVGGIPEAIINARTGILITPGDVEALANGIITLLGDDELRQRIVQNAYTYVAERFDVDGVLRHLYEVYEALLSKPL